ncbi:MAG: molecular chaperone HtpG [Ignavibacteria bacterium]|nr:molecular chaperone HtpG [Ignavibacteria bacterium]
MSTNEQNKFEFKAEIRQLLDILVHSLYTSREIFLRELVSNASDALDKLRFESLKGSEYANPELPLEIKITFDEKQNILTIADTGIGMTREELISNIGTIAKSGSSDFVKKLTEAKEDASNIIGKFGVGFYSVFMVAKEVNITTRSYKKDAVAIKWSSDGLGEYTLADVADDTPRGTTIEIHLKDDASEFAKQYRLEQIIKTHSNFISFPIYLESQKVNTVAALWCEPKSKITQEQYDEFYKFLSYDNSSPADSIHVSVDAPIQFNALLFIPQKNMDIFGFHKEEHGLDLYVRRVLIQHKNQDLLPEYLGFVKGIVDSEDLPLNISRETLQENAVFTKISKAVTSQVYSHLAKKAKENPDKYAEFWKEHAKVFKMGYGDFENKDKFVELLRFNSSLNEDEKGLTSLEEYKEKMRDGQKEIYYIFGPSRSAIEFDPLLEIFKRKGIPILYLTDPVDEFVLSSIRNYKDLEFCPANTKDTEKIEKFDDINEVSSQFEKLSNDDELQFGSLLAKMKEILGDAVLEVKESNRLTNSAICLVNQDDNFSATFQRIMRMANKDMGAPKKILLVNRNNKLVRNLISIFKTDSNSEYLKNMIIQLHEIAQLTEGDLVDPHALANRLLHYFEDSSDWFVTK